MKNANKLLLPMLFTLLLISCSDNRKGAPQEKSYINGKEVDDRDKAKDGFDTLKSRELYPSDKDFALTAADGGMLEQKAGELAVSKGMGAAIKQLGQMMVTDHGKANAELKALAEQLKIALPPSLSQKSQSKYDKLKEMQGLQFDKEFSSLMVYDHHETIDLFKQEAANGKNSVLKDWATGKIPILTHHLEMSREVNADLNKKSTGVY